MQIANKDNGDNTMKGIYDKVQKRINDIKLNAV